MLDLHHWDPLEKRAWLAVGRLMLGWSAAERDVLGLLAVLQPGASDPDGQYRFKERLKTAKGLVDTLLRGAPAQEEFKAARAVLTRLKPLRDDLATGLVVVDRASAERPVLKLRRLEDKTRHAPTQDLPLDDIEAAAGELEHARTRIDGVRRAAQAAIAQGR